MNLTNTISLLEKMVTINNDGIMIFEDLRIHVDKDDAKSADLILHIIEEDEDATFDDAVNLLFQAFIYAVRDELRKTSIEDINVLDNQPMANFLISLWWTIFLGRQNSAGKTSQDNEDLLNEARRHMGLDHG